MVSFPRQPIEDTFLGMALNRPEILPELLKQGVSVAWFYEPVNRELWLNYEAGTLGELKYHYPKRIARLKEKAPLTQNIMHYVAELRWRHERLHLAARLEILTKRIVNRKDWASVADVRKLLDEVMAEVAVMEACEHGEG